MLGKEILQTLDDHDRCDPDVKHQAMVLVTYVDEAKQFATQLDATAEEKIAAAYTGDTKNSDHILQSFENGKEIINCILLKENLVNFDRSLSIV